MRSSSGAQRANAREHRGLQAAEAEVEVAARDHRAAGSRSASHRPPAASCASAGPPGIAEAEQRRGLVERFARGVVLGLAEQRVASDAVDAHELRVPARDEQRDERETRAAARRAAARGGGPRGDGCRPRACRARCRVPVATEAPTRSAPPSPGPCVKATRSTSSMRRAGARSSTAGHERQQAPHVVARGELRDDAAIERRAARPANAARRRAGPSRVS